MDTFRLTTDDGVELDADLTMTSVPARGAVVVCHPHPLFGGDRHNNVVTTLFDALPRSGYHALRFDFRRADGDGASERLDVLAGLRAMRDRAPGAPLILVGYSFGAMVALTVDDPAVAALVAIAPTLSSESPAPAVRSPIHLIVPEQDEYAPPATVSKAVGRWPRTTRERVSLDVIPYAGHLLTGGIAVMKQTVLEWLDDRFEPVTGRSRDAG